MHWIIGVEKIHFIHNFIIFWSQDLSFQAKIKKFIDNVTNILAEPKVSNVDLFSTMILWNSIGSPPSYSKLSTCHVKNIRRLFGLTNGAFFSLMSLNQLSPCSVFTWKKLFPTSKCHWVFRILIFFFLMQEFLICSQTVMWSKSWKIGFFPKIVLYPCSPREFQDTLIPRGQILKGFVQ